MRGNMVVSKGAFVAAEDKKQSDIWTTELWIKTLSDIIVKTLTHNSQCDIPRPQAAAEAMRAIFCLSTSETIGHRSQPSWYRLSLE